MLKVFAWEMFKRTGSIDCYMLYKEVERIEASARMKSLESETALDPGMFLSPGLAGQGV